MFSLVFAIIITSQFMAYYFRSEASKIGMSILSPLHKIDSIERLSIEYQSSINGVELKKLKTLFSILSQKKEHHKLIFMEMYRYHFASVTMLIILSSISAVFIFIAAQNGIRNANPNFQITFYVLAALTTFYALSPVVYKQDTSISSNLNSYIKFDNLQSQVYNYALVTTSDTAITDSVSFIRFHSSIIDKIQELNKIDLQFDYKSIPSPDFFKN
ncbi:hypothetical protein PBAL39_00737 [Pedobacter sp. BAL39]|nr:hypothetical protein PBAL39_00737 [Pedobacter sp. BAL39]